MISYAQNGEDMVLWHAFGEQSSGFFVDVGANLPTHDSVTRAFYDRGWSGVNIEPQVSCYRELCEERPRDVNLNIGIAGAAGNLTFHLVPDAPAMSTFSTDHVRQVHELGYRTEEHHVDVRPLGEVFAEHVADRTVEFLKVDVEGLEQQVLGGFDWNRWRPRVVLVESRPDVSPWEAEMLAAGYHRTLWDGINLFFVRGEDLAALGEAVSRPATIVLDRYDPWLYVEQLRTATDRLTALLTDHVGRALAARSRGVEHPEAAQALGQVLSRRPDVVDHFGGPPGADMAAILEWAGATDQRRGEPGAAELEPYADLYRRLAFAAVTATGIGEERSGTPRRLLGRAKQSLPPGIRHRLAGVRARLRR